ncbi:MAG: hypothetical protein IT237_02155 [Bacteroidia bacterium]|nr:hypothetical protein [Bacteroidia bacterium]
MSTPLTIKNLPFVCVRLNDADFKDVAAIYVIICVSESGSWKVIDVGQSGQLGTRIDDHPRMDCWKNNCPSGNIWVCIYKTPTADMTKDQRLALEKELRDFYKPNCGDR